MKKILICLSLVLCGYSSLLFAQNINWDVAKSDPIGLLDAVVDKANEEHRIQETKLDRVGEGNGGGFSGNPQYRLTNTLEYLKNNIDPYLQRIVFIGLAIATILLIYNGFIMTTNVLHGKGELSKVKDNFIWIGIGVVILTGFYYLIDIVVAVINFLFG
ncbi:MAG: hypothetical protein LBG52_03350 [Candidatus Peribacteria bacterium]|jgi:hypothetical protein|nr:hypothetical protein [Candidatus Peribacteria bacterium]